LIFSEKFLMLKMNSPMISVESATFQKVTSKPGQRVRFRINDKALCVEEAVIEHYKTKGYKALWAENEFWALLLLLCFWDVIFLKIKGAVRWGGVDLEVQDRNFDLIFEKVVRTMVRPYDFFKPQFYERRKAFIEERIRHLQQQELGQILMQNYLLHKGSVRPWLARKRFGIQDCVGAVKAVGDKNILMILHRLISDYGARRSGFPDLIVYKDDTLFFCEVKSENDVVASHQSEWHNYFAEELGIKVVILNVISQNS